MDLAVLAFFAWLETILSTIGNFHCITGSVAVELLRLRYVPAVPSAGCNDVDVMRGYSGGEFVFGETMAWVRSATYHLEGGRSYDVIAYDSNANPPKTVLVGNLSVLHPALLLKQYRAVAEEWGVSEEKQKSAEQKCAILEEVLDSADFQRDYPQIEQQWGRGGGSPVRSLSFDD